MSAVAQPEARDSASSRASPGAVAARLLLHGGFLLVAVGCFAAYAHFEAEGNTNASLASLVAAAGFGFAPVRDVVRIALAVEGKALHLVHALGGLALVGLPLAGVVSGGPVLTHAALAPFAIMGAAQAVMHQDHPRNAEQAAAMRRFAQSLPEVAQFTSAKTSPRPRTRSARSRCCPTSSPRPRRWARPSSSRDPGFQSALRQVSTRFGANLGLDAVDLALAKLAANPATAGAVPRLRKQLTKARKTIASAGAR